MAEECVEETAIRKSFVFLKENLNYDDLIDELIQNNLVDVREKETYICKFRNNYFKIEKLIKLMIERKRCKEFVEIIGGMECYRHVFEKIRKARHQTLEGEHRTTQITDESLQRHFGLLYMNLEPREIADEMLKSGHFSIADHDDVADCDTKYRRLEKLLLILKSKQLYSQLENIVRVLHYDTTLSTLETENRWTFKLCEYALCLQQNFTLLQYELPNTDYLMKLMSIFLDEITSSDIKSLSGDIFQKSKLLKMLMTKGEQPCRGFFRLIRREMEREDLLRKMMNNSFDIQKRGKPILDQRFEGLTISCLIEHEELLKDLLEPLSFSDDLFEELALDILEHDRITEEKSRKQQATYLLDTVKKDQNECFHYFQWILQQKRHDDITELLRSASVTESKENTVTLHQTIITLPANIPNEPLDLKLKLNLTFKEDEEAVHMKFLSDDTGMSLEVISHGEMTIASVDEGSVVFRLKPITDEAVQNLLNAKANNRLVNMVYGILKQINISERMRSSGLQSLEVKVQVCYEPLTTTYEASRLNRQVRACKKEFVSSMLEPKRLTTLLAKSAVFPQNEIEKINAAPDRCERIEKLLSFIEHGNSTVFEEFVAVLKDLGYHEYAELINPTDLHNKAKDIKGKIIKNYKSILDEMQIKLVEETLSSCIGDICKIQEKMLPQNGSRKKRMNEFLQFVLQEDFNVIRFEKMLRNNGIENLLEMNETTQDISQTIQDIEVTIADEENLASQSEEILFESIIIMSQIGAEVHNRFYKSRSFQHFHYMFELARDCASRVKCLVKDIQLPSNVIGIRYIGEVTKDNLKQVTKRKETRELHKGSKIWEASPLICFQNDFPLLVAVKLLRSEEACHKILVTSSSLDLINEDFEDDGIVIVARDYVQKAITSCLEEPFHYLFNDWTSKLESISSNASISIISEIENIRNEMALEEPTEIPLQIHTGYRNVVPRDIKEYLSRNALVNAFGLWRLGVFKVFVRKGTDKKLLHDQLLRINREFFRKYQLDIENKFFGVTLTMKQGDMISPYTSDVTEKPRQGTVGCFVTKTDDSEKIYALTCHHMFPVEGLSAYDDQFVEIGKCVFTTKEKHCDFAAIEINESVSHNCDITFHRDDNKKTNARVYDGSLDNLGIVHKIGSGSGVTSGTIMSNEFYWGDLLHDTDDSVFLVRGMHGPFSQSGDSGAIVFSRPKQVEQNYVNVVGMVVGECNDKHEDDVDDAAIRTETFTFCNRVRPALQLFEQQKSVCVKFKDDLSSSDSESDIDFA